MSSSFTKCTDCHPLEHDVLYVPTVALIELAHRLEAPNLIQVLCEIMLEQAEADWDALPPLNTYQGATR